ncbi:protein c-ets-2 [Plakobranchus ocellatus]|uniref:Protein c-ets-2 n=1 Tax=Plakobranchus ocellatus TaxID=259542 RepID=A0AAV4AW94_9GAST|nr:protein c-ets-2 [Plakobranchus ocellatus]
MMSTILSLSLTPSPTPRPSIADPYQWSPVHVSQWLQWFTHEFSFEGLQMSNFQMDGRELCNLDKKEFLERCPPYIGDIIWEHLDMMKKEMREERAQLCNAPPNYSEAMCMHEFNDRIHRSFSSASDQSMTSVTSTCPPYPEGGFAIADSLHSLSDIHGDSSHNNNNSNNNNSSTTPCGSSGSRNVLTPSNNNTNISNSNNNNNHNNTDRSGSSMDDTVDGYRLFDLSNSSNNNKNNHNNNNNGNHNSNNNNNTSHFFDIRPHKEYFAQPEHKPMCAPQSTG